MSEEAKNEVQHYEDPDDGFASFNLEQLGQRTSAFGGARVLKFNRGQFITREGEEIKPDRQLIALGLAKIIQKFVDKKLVETRIVPPKEKFPDLEEMNASAPKEEWGLNLNNEPVGPFVKVLVLRLLDRQTMDRYAFVTSSIGGSIALGDLSDKTKIIRRIKGANVTAVVSCQSALMKSSFNPRGVPRPDFRVVEWIALAAPPESIGVTTPTPPTSLPPAKAPPTAPEAPPAPAVAAPAAAATPAAATPAAAAPLAPAAVFTPAAVVAPVAVVTPAAALDTFAAAPAAPIKTVDAGAVGVVVLPPTVREELKDEIIF